jgi:hypothetical protein
MAAWLTALAQVLHAWRRGERSPQGWAVLAVAPVLLLGAGLPQSHQLRYYLPLLLLPDLTALAWGWQHLSQRWIQTVLLAPLSLALLLNFTQPLHSTLKGWRQGQGLSYAVHYPVRDLPTAAACLRQGMLSAAQPAARPEDQRAAQPQTLQLPTGQAFACRLQLPDTIRVEEVPIPAQTSPAALSGRG